MLLIVGCVLVVYWISTVSLHDPVGLGKGSESYRVFLPYLWWSAAPKPGAVLISEVLYNPTGSEPDGEWIELYNPGDNPFELGGYRLGDEETPGQNEGMVYFAAGARLDPGQVIVIARQAAIFREVYGFLPDFELVNSLAEVPDLAKDLQTSSGSVDLANSGDEVLLRDPGGNLVDAVSWGSSIWAFSPSIRGAGEGVSIERYPPWIDTDRAADWRLQYHPDPGDVDTTLPTATPSPSRTSTPTPPTLPTASATAAVTALPGSTLTVTGTPAAFPTHSATPTQTPATTSTPSETPTPTAVEPAARLLLSEVLYNPWFEDVGSEWVEIFNPLSTTVKLSGYGLGDEETPGENEGMYRFPAQTWLPAGEVLLIANQAQEFYDRYGFYPDFEMEDSVPSVPDLLPDLAWGTGDFLLSNSGDEVLLLGPADELVDAISYGDSSWAFDPPIPTVAEGNSLERYPPDLDTDQASDWRNQDQPNPGELSMNHYTGKKDLKKPLDGMTRALEILIWLEEN